MPNELNHVNSDTKPFNGKTFFETKITTEITANELQILELIRSMPFGELTIKRANGSIARIEKHESFLPKEIEPKL